MAVDAREILTFWFGDPATEDTSYAARRKLWFGKLADLDQEILSRFRASYNQAASGQLEDWQGLPNSALALVLLLDQFPRNMFRGTPQAFATDSQALAIAKEAIAQNFDQQLKPVQRLFLYLPLEHSENLVDQEQSVALFRQLHADSPELKDTLDYAIRHYDVIQQFGRFPHRNDILNRTSTAAEVEFLKQPGSSF
jgi:uncharacterized protein (DUF924 family)